MKIGPGFPPPPPSPSVSPPSAPLQPFSHFYGDPKSREGGTFGFAELGMFGLPDSRSIAPVPVQSEPRAQPLLSAPPVTLVRSLAAGALLPATSRPETADRAAPEPAIADAARSGPMRVKPAIPDVNAARIALVEAAAAEGPVAEPATSDEYRSISGRRLPDRPERSKSDVSVVLREKAGEAELVVGAPPLDPGARSILRQLVRAILARSGLKLARLQLNGSAVAPATFSHVNGDSHGFGSR